MTDNAPNTNAKWNGQAFHTLLLKAECLRRLQLYPCSNNMKVREIYAVACPPYGSLKPYTIATKLPNVRAPMNIPYLE